MGLFAGTKWDVPAHCEKCDKLESECNCLPVPAEPRSPASQTLKVRLEKRKAGRVVTIVSGLAPDDPGRADLLTRIKNNCGAGGTVEENNLLIQGDQQEKVTKQLQSIGYRIKN